VGSKVTLSSSLLFWCEIVLGFSFSVMSHIQGVRKSCWLYFLHYESTIHPYYTCSDEFSSLSPYLCSTPYTLILKTAVWAILQKSKSDYIAPLQKAPSPDPI
jgi:hypothetical protein